MNSTFIECFRISFRLMIANKLESETFHTNSAEFNWTDFDIDLWLYRVGSLDQQDFNILPFSGIQVCSDQAEPVLL